MPLINDLRGTNLARTGTGVVMAFGRFTGHFRAVWMAFSLLIGLSVAGPVSGSVLAAAPPAAHCEREGCEAEEVELVDLVRGRAVRHARTRKASLTFLLRAESARASSLYSHRLHPIMVA